ncbi:MAG: SDR family NAD(P)-dependent oxidoreductase [Acutalibacteraceae bacterium]
MTAVITGASSGIGKATAKMLIDNGYETYNLSRTPCDIDGVISIKCDITKEEDVKSAFEQIEKVDLLINNAGFGIAGAIELTDESDIQRQFDFNFFAQIRVIRYALPKLRETHGRIINISSAASVFPIPFQSFYSATKASLESMTAALRNELKNFSISVGSLRLGDVKTGFTSARVKNTSDGGVYGGKISKSIAVMERDEQNGMPTEKIASAVFKAAKKRRLPLVTTVGVKYKLLCLLNRLLPQGAVNALIGKIYIPD